MITINARNVNDALYNVFWTVCNQSKSRSISSRGGDTYEFIEPVSIMYRHPTERVLLNEFRDANPFFHLFEALWILAGRDDVEWIAQFNRRMHEYSDDGVTFHGAYGARLVSGFHVHQIHEAIHMLIDDPGSRRVVLQLWDPQEDLNKKSKDLPCNLSIALKIRDGHLNMTVFNRSNDVIWGAFGTNVVHFSILQEYIAHRVGVKVGAYHQVSDSLHFYVDNPQYHRLIDWCRATDPTEFQNPYNHFGWAATGMIPLVSSSIRWHMELARFMREDWDEPPTPYQEPFFADIAVPMRRIWERHRATGDGLELIRNIRALDWRAAARIWLRKREKADEGERR